MEKDDVLINATSLYPGSYKDPDVAPSTNADSHGALAGNDDIALYGRKKNEIILTKDDVRIRCGSRLKENSAQGNIIFNRNDPAYILLRHTDTKNGNKNNEYRSTATIVADKINLIGNQSKEPFKTNDKKDLIDNNEMQKIIDKAHKLPYGDILVEFLKMFVDAFAKHVHPYPGMPPCGGTFGYDELQRYMFNEILSDNVRIS
jgi:hypothetical protein